MEQKYTLTLFMRRGGCLVVGGGKVGTRKIGSLIESGIQKITVVSPSVTDDIRQWIAEGRVNWLPREYEAVDSENMDLVFAVTPFEAVNKAVLASGKHYHVLSATADENWREGAFISPASVRHEGLTVSVSTGGVSCRQSRMVKDWIARHLGRIQGSELFIIGTDHQLLPIQQREPLHLNGKRYQEVGEMISLISGVHEFMLLNTCNRVELIGVGSPDTITEGTLIRLMGFNGLSKSSYYVKKGKEAYRHFAVMTSGLLSQTPGENHITAQVKEAFEVSESAGWAGKTIRESLNAALHLSRHIRTAVSPMLKPTEIESLCKLYIDKEFGDIKDRNVLLVGTGMVGESLMRELTGSGARIFWCYHRQMPTMPEGSENVTLVQLNNLKEHLPNTDLLITAVSAEHPILHTGHAAFFDPDREFTAIDLSIPRNIAAELVTMIPQMNLIDLDDLKHWYRREACDMTRIMQVVADVLDEHTELYEKWSRSVRGENTHESVS